MSIFHTFLTVMQVLSAIAVIVLVLLQHGKGADMGAAFGSGSSGSLFGASGSANFLSRATAFCATIFLLCTLGLAFYARADVAPQSGGVMEAIQATPAEGAATPAENKPAQPSTPVQDIPK
ncbi:MAG TPA: preprotein translocase subunit SecG [Limnobacter sp.]|nr:preprotein translocase subunit SecG [Limnobacter sp.]